MNVWSLIESARTTGLAGRLTRRENPAMPWRKGIRIEVGGRISGGSRADAESEPSADEHPSV
jgi:hypothetical protein